MPVKEATARIKINKLLEAAGWRFFDDAAGAANIQLEPQVKLKTQDLDALGQDFEKSSRGFIDFLLLNEKGFSFIVLEAKAEDKNPLVGKEQARKYAKSQNCRFIILSNGNLHYFWDLERGDPYIVTAFPNPASVAGYQKTKPDTTRLVSEVVGSDYVALTQMPHYAAQAAWKNVDERPKFEVENKLRFLRPYQLKAVAALQAAVQSGKDRFLFEMATGTGKTLTAAAIIKLFLRTGNAQRVLFLVDRLELEDQAQKAFVSTLKNSFKSVIYKESRDDWRHAEIVVTTVQSLLFNNKYQRLFSPTDFDLVISDEAHRSIGGNARAVFNYFVGFKLGLTATPRDYLKNLNDAPAPSHSQRDLERRLLLDTYRTFGCDDGTPTFRYSLLDGVKDCFLINPTVVDARSSITTQLLSEQGLTVEIKDDEGNTQTDTFGQREFEKRFFSETTNQLLCKTFLENALRDPVSQEIGKSIIFAVSQNHAAKLTQILNEMAARMFRAKYQSDFAVQVTSLIPDAQQFTINFTNNNLLGSANFNALYKTSKARVCVTVGMMTTGYDCPDLLNLGLFRPIFSPTDFIQIKGRGTRKHNFLEQLFDENLKAAIAAPQKTSYKLFDFFANCEYFEQEFKYDEVLKLPKPKTHSSGQGTGGGEGPEPPQPQTYEHQDDDYLHQINEEVIGYQGMKIDRMFYDKFEDTARADKTLQAAVAAQQWELAEDYIKREIADKPSEFFNLDKLRRAAGVDRRLSWREVLEKAFGLIDHHKSTDELLEEEFSKFVSDVQPSEWSAIPALKNYFKAYATSDHVRHIIKQQSYADLATYQPFSSKDFRAVPETYRQLIPSYIKDYVSLNQFL
jgi:type I restriction enzyme, R subunit